MSCSSSCPGPRRRKKISEDNPINFAQRSTRVTQNTWMQTGAISTNLTRGWRRASNVKMDINNTQTGTVHSFGAMQDSFATEKYICFKISTISTKINDKLCGDACALASSFPLSLSFVLGCDEADNEIYLYVLIKEMKPPIENE